MADWATISALATAGGTLVLAAATFSAVRSGNRAARVAERSLQVGVRPVLMPSRLEDGSQKVMWFDEHWAHVDGGRGSAEVVDGNIYLAMSLRNVGAGIAVLQAWNPGPAWEQAAREPHAEPDRFRPQTRDLYVPAGDVSFWQAAVRDSDDESHAFLRETIEQRRILIVDLLYTDHEGGQRTISRFSLIPRGEAEWLCTVARHWNLDRPDPR
jgi:hypothetical protein